MAEEMGSEESTEEAERLRAELVEDLVADGTIKTEAVRNAFRAVPRHLFVPEASLADAYARFAVTTRTDERGQATSSVSDPHIQAVMLELADIEPGMSVLEIGSGGYNAALIQELVSATGSVLSVDIDAVVVDRARKFLDEAGYEMVTVVQADAENPVPGAPFDRILVTAGAWDIPPSWREQLAEGGRLIVPLRTFGVTRVVALDSIDGLLRGQMSAPAGFVPVLGAGAHTERTWMLKGEQVAIVMDDGELDDPSRLDGLLAKERSEAWSSATIGRSEPFDFLYLYLACELDGFVRMHADGSDGDPGLGLEPGEKFFPFAHVYKGDSLAFMVVRPTEEASRVELGARALGPHAAQAAEAMAEAMRGWDLLRDGHGPLYQVHPAQTPDDELKAGLVLDKRHSRIVISWPAE